jgi:hypothetical protein
LVVVVCSRRTVAAVYESEPFFFYWFYFSRLWTSSGRRVCGNSFSCCFLVCPIAADISERMCESGTALVFFGAMRRHFHRRSTSHGSAHFPSRLFKWIEATSMACGVTWWRWLVVANGKSLTSSVGRIIAWNVKGRTERRKESGLSRRPVMSRRGYWYPSHLDLMGLHPAGTKLVKSGSYANDQRSMERDEQLLMTGSSSSKWFSLTSLSTGQ